MENQAVEIVETPKKEKRLEQMRNYTKKYYTENKQKLNTDKNVKVCCNICNKTVVKGHLVKHQQTANCKLARNDKIENLLEDLKVLIKFKDDNRITK